jgi:hypothetical protein
MQRTGFFFPQNCEFSNATYDEIFAPIHQTEQMEEHQPIRHNRGNNMPDVFCNLSNLLNTPPMLPVEQLSFMKWLKNHISIYKF